MRADRQGPRDGEQVWAEWVSFGLGGLLLAACVAATAGAVYWSLTPAPRHHATSAGDAQGQRP